MISTCAAQTPPPAPPRTETPEVKTYTLPPEKFQKAVELARARNQLHFIDAAWGMLILVGVLAWRVGPRLRDVAEHVSRRRVVQAFVFAPLLFLVTDALDMPAAVYSQHLELKYERSVQSWSSWLWDWTKGELIGYVLAGFLVWILYGVIRRSPRRWWFYFGLTAVPIIIFLNFLQPMIIAPLFNKFEPLAAKQPGLVAAIGKVVTRGGLEIPADRMFQMDASAKVNTLNAYVAGVGASKRVVVWDTTIQKMTQDQILFTFGHEMGHYVLNHVWLLIAASCGGIFVFLWLGYHVTGWALEKWKDRWAIRGMADWASLPALLLAVSIFAFVSEPLVNSFSRVLEHNADIYGLEVTHGLVPDSAQTAAQAFQILGEVDLSDPDPSAFVKFWLYNHPALTERVRFAAEYNPWGKGEATRYVK